MRKPNKRTSLPLAIVLVFKPHEFAFLQWNEPGAGGLGGYQNHENRLIELTDPDSLICALDAEDFTRTVVYCQKTDKGGPQSHIRAACIPALRRANIDVVPQWRAPIEEVAHASAH